MIKRFNVMNMEAALQYLKRNYLFVGLCLVLLVGVFIGSLCAGQTIATGSPQLSELFQSYIARRAAQGFWLNTLHSLVGLLPYLLFAYISGLFVWGMPVVPCTPFSYGLGLGAFCGYLYATYGLKGTAFSLLTRIPPGFLTAILLAVASRDSFNFSKSLLYCHIRNQAIVLPRDRFKQYHIQYGIYFLLLLLISAIDSLLCVVFLDVFGF